MDKKQIKQVAKSLLFDVNDEVIKDFASFFEDHMSDLAKLEAINTDGIEPMYYVDPTPMTLMRDDKPGKCLPKKQLLANAQKKNNDFIILPRAVGDAD